jgi:S1-C subfamily serine protease
MTTSRCSPSTGTRSNPFDGTTLLPVDPETNHALRLASPHGLLVQRIEPGSALYSAEVRPGDELLKLEGHPLDSLTAALETLVKRTPGQALTLEYANRAGSERATLIIEADQAPA